MQEVQSNPPAQAMHRICQKMQCMWEAEPLLWGMKQHAGAKEAGKHEQYRKIQIKVERADQKVSRQ